MRGIVGQLITLQKLRIGFAIAASAMAGMLVTKGHSLTFLQASGFALAVLGGAGAAGAFNHYFDRDIDLRMRRTRGRPFATGVLQSSAWWPISFAILFVASFALAVATGGMVAGLYVFLGAFVYGIVYTVWLKRRTPWNIVVGGLAGSFAVLAGAAAIDPAPQIVPCILAVVLFLWTPPHFWSLAAARADDYASAGVPMLPVTAPQAVWTWAILAHVAALAALSLLPLAFGLGLSYGAGALIGGAYFLWRSWRLCRWPGRDSAIGNFKASLVQLSLLILGVVADRFVG